MKVHRVTILCAALSGICGLSYQVNYQALFVALMGSDALASALVVSLFLFGLGVGNEIGARLSRSASQRNFLLLAARSEFIVGLWSYMLASTLSVWQKLSLFLIDLSTNAHLADLAVASALVFPPTVAMGAVIPFLCRALDSQEESPGRLHALLYGLNSAGAVLGCLLAGVFVLPHFGIRTGLYIFGSLSLLIGFLLRSASKRGGVPESGTSVPSKQSVPVSLRAQAIAFGSGWCVLTFEIILLRLSGWAAGASLFLFSIVVAAFIFLSSVAAILVRLVLTFEETTVQKWLKILPIIFVAWVSVLILYVPHLSYYAHLLRIVFPATEAAMLPYFFACFVALVLILAPVVMPLSILVPILVHERSRFDNVGSVAGTLWRWNLFGCVLGVLGAGYFWFSLGSLGTLFKITSISSLVMLLALIAPYRSSLQIAISTCVLYIALQALPAWDSLRMSVGMFYLREAEPSSALGAEAFFVAMLKDGKALAARDDMHGRVSVVDYPSADSLQSERVLYIDGKPDGNTVGDSVSMRVLGHLPALFAGSTSSDAAVIGFGTGMSAGALTLHPDLKHIDMFEISKAVKDFAPLFDDANHQLSTSPKVSWILGDAYRSLMRTKKKYAVIACQPSTPWMPGIDRLYTVEFLRVAANALAPDGVYVDWYPLYDTSPETVRLALQTFSDVFPHIRLFNFDNNIVVLASLNPNHFLDLSSVVKRMQAPAVGAELKAIGLASLGEILAHEAWLPKKLAHAGQGNSLYKNRLGVQAAKDFFVGRTTDASELISTREDLKDLVLASKESLLVQALNLGLIAQTTDELVKITCGDTALKLVEPTWRLIRSPCRDLIVRAMIEERVTTPPGARAVIDRARRWKQTGRSLSLPEVTHHLETFVQLYSGMLPLDERVLLEDARFCKTLGAAGETCLDQIRKTFSQFGLDVALHELQSY